MAECFSFVVALAMGVHAAQGPGAGEPRLVPRPERMEWTRDAWILEPGARLVAEGPAAEGPVPAGGAAEGAAAEEAARLADALSAPLGRRLQVAAGAPGPGDIALRLEPSRSDLGDEGYELSVARDGVRITARRPAGLFHGGQTLRQLLPDAAWAKAPADGKPWAAPCVRILDRPRFAWRGLLLDPARHFIAKASLREIIDGMAMHKLNRLQLHLTDDQGWRIEIRAFPRLTARSSWRDGTQLGHASEQPERISAVAHGGYYTQDDLREIVAYAAARHIVVVPEIEMPGHGRAWIAAYPELAVFPEKAAGAELWRRWGISRDVLAPRPKTLEACRRVLDEVCEIFPSPWIHIGGDEAPRDQWRESAEMQDLIRSLGLRNEDELQAWFTAELSRHLASKGRRLVGWDEILAGAKLEGGAGKTTLDPGAVVMSWRGEEGGKAATRAGHDAIMAPNAWTYLDYYQGPPAEEPVAIGGSVSFARAHAYEPVPASLPEEAARRILGGQTQVWGEYLSSFDAVGYMAFPRACALAEVFWSPREGKDLVDFLGRLERHEGRLRAAGIPCRPLARRTSLPDAAGRILALPRDAVIHGTEIVRQEDGSLAHWRDPLTLIAWRVDLPAAGAYRVRALLQGSAPSEKAWLEALVAGRALRAGLSESAEALDLGLLEADRPGPRLFFLRAGGTPGPDGFPVVRGVELVPER